MKRLNNILESIYFLACYDYIEYLFEIQLEIRQKNPNFNFKEIKTITFIYLEELFKKDILLAKETFDNIPVADSIKEIREVIDVRWTEDLEYPGFFNLVSFYRPKWYIDKIKSDGHNFNNWEDRVEKTPWLQDLLKVDEQEIQRKFQERLMHPPVISDKRRQEIQQKYREKLSLMRKRSREIQEKDPPKPDLSNKNFLQRLWYWLLTN